jgi:quercetin dioxygenase-like cupin family protein
LGAMKPRDIRDLVHFSEEEPHHETLFESEHLWSEVICLAGSQGLGPMTDAASDAVLAVLSGEVATQVDKTRSRLKQWDSLLVPAGSELTLKNASPDPAVVLLVAAPPPTPTV